MALDDVLVQKGGAGLGRALPGQDYISGLIMYMGGLPTGFTTTLNKKQIFSLNDAVNLGINLNYTDETVPRAVFTVSAGATVAGETLQLQVNAPITNADGTPGINVINFGTYTTVTEDIGSMTSIAAGIEALINSGTTTHGFVATLSSAAVTVIAPHGFGVSLNNPAAAFAVTISMGAGSAGAWTQPPTSGTSGSAVAGVYSKKALLYYHISEFFRIQPNGQLWVGLYPVPGGDYSFTELSDLQQYTGGTLRQCAIYADALEYASDNSQTTTIQNVELTLEAIHMPLSVLFAANIQPVTITDLEDLSTLSNNKVSVIIGQDGGAVGAGLFITSGVSVTCIGAALGAVALSAVNEDISWVQKFQMSNGVELNVLAFADGTRYGTVSASQLGELNDYRYIFLRSFVGRTGSYFNDNHCAIAQSSDYAYINDNRTWDKAARGVYSNTLSFLGGTVILNADGTMSNNTIAYVTALVANPLDAMVRNSEISDYKVYINPAQNVDVTSQVVIGVSLEEDGVARNIIINMGFVALIS